MYYIVVKTYVSSIYISKLYIYLVFCCYLRHYHHHWIII